MPAYSIFTVCFYLWLLKIPCNIRYDLLSTKHLLPPNQFAKFEDKYLRLVIGETFRFTGEFKYFKLHKFQVYTWISKKKPEINKSSENTLAKLTMIRFKLYTNKRKQLTPSRKHWRYFVERGGLEISKTNLLIQILRIFYDATWQLFRTPVLSSHINFTQTRTIHQVQTYSTWSKWEDNSSKREDNNLM